MNNKDSLFRLLESVTVDSKDNGSVFTLTNRCNVIESLLEGSSYKLIARQPLALLYSKSEPGCGDRVVLLSSHIDCVYPSLFCKDIGEGMHGTFDNSFGNAAALWSMLNDTLPGNTVVAFTGDEEVESRGALQAVELLEERGVVVSATVVLDVTNSGWNSQSLFAVENDFGFDMLTAYEIVSALEPYSGRFSYMHNALPDETFLYTQKGYPSLSLCLPVGGDIHSSSGVLLRKESALEYCRVLPVLLNIFSGN